MFKKMLKERENAIELREKKFELEKWYWEENKENEINKIKLALQLERSKEEQEWHHQLGVSIQENLKSQISDNKIFIDKVLKVIEGLRPGNSRVEVIK